MIDISRLRLTTHVACRRLRSCQRFQREAAFRSGGEFTRGIDPALERSRQTTWKEFLIRHWELIVAADFFTVEVWTRRGLRRFNVLFFIELSTRKVEIAGIAEAADGLWMRQIGRNLSDAVTTRSKITRASPID